MKKLLCLGDACVDIVIPYGKAKKGEDVSPSYYSGGTVANTASGLGKLGVDCMFFGKAGNDLFGKLMLHDLEQDGVDTKYFTLDSTLSSVMIMAVIDENNDRFPFLVPREKPSHLELYPTDFPETIFDEISHVHTSGLMLFENPAAETVCTFLEECSRRNITVSLDVNLRIETAHQDTTYLKRAIACTNYLLGSGEDEFVPLTGAKTVEKAAKLLTNQNRVVISRMGAKGANVYTVQGMEHFDGFSVEVVDTLGAGDAYNSGFLYGISKGLSPQQANICGCAAGALNITKAGARNCPSKEKLMQFFSEKNINLTEF